MVQRLNSHAQLRLLCYVMVYAADKTPAGRAAMGSNSKAPLQTASCALSLTQACKLHNKWG